MNAGDVDGVNTNSQAVEQRRRLRELAETAAPADADVLQLGAEMVVANLAVNAVVAG
jgi:hypothetical protein